MLSQSTKGDRPLITSVAQLAEKKPEELFRIINDLQLEVGLSARDLSQLNTDLGDAESQRLYEVSQKSIMMDMLIVLAGSRRKAEKLIHEMQPTAAILYRVWSQELDSDYPETKIPREFLQLAQAD